MKIRGLIVAAFVFFILAGILYWSERHKPGEDSAKASADAAPSILKLDSAAITRLELRKSSAQPIVLAKTDSGWKITEPQPFGADQSAVSGMLSTLSSLNSERLVEDKAANLKQYGLDQPTFQVEIDEKDNKTQKLLIGDDTPTGSASYAMLAGDPRVFTVGSYAKTSVNKSLNDLRDKRLLAVDADKISRVEIVRKNKDIEFVRNKDEWQILKPKVLRADSDQVSELVRKLTDAKMDLNSSDTKNVTSAFAHATPLATAKLTDQSGTLELEVRRSQTDNHNSVYYAKSSAGEGAYKINSDLGQALDKSLDDFRDKKLFDFGFAEPNKVELHVGSKAYFFVRSGEDWWQDGKKLDVVSVQSFISKLRDLTAVKFLDSGFANPTIEIAATSDDGKRVEKILIAKANDGYVAKREDGTDLYQLSASSVDDLQKAADSIKPAAAPSK
ncbi:MAG: DUF4340 domain-containing protein [Candidatus Sulfotelmatobacter sp.]